MTKRTLIITALLSTILGGVTACAGNSSHASQAQTYDRQAIQTQIETVLTPDQVTQLHSKEQQGQKMREALSSLNLTADQKTKIQQIFQSIHTHKHNQPQNSP
jgi:Spy/CpxP family protein refolding chaperone